MGKELKVTKEAVLRAAKSCPDARRILENMFPEAFVNEERARVFRGNMTNSIYIVMGKETLACFRRDGTQDASIWSPGGSPGVFTELK